MRPIARRTVIAFPAIALTAALQCSDDSVSHNGGSTTETAVVMGRLYLPDGATPAAGVRVRIRPRATLADTARIAKALADTASVLTNTSGEFAFDTTLDTGTYVIEAASGNDAVLIDSVTVQSRDTTRHLPPDTLKPAGALKGVIRLSEGGDPRKVFVLAFGIDRFARVDSGGAFRFANLAEARYDLRLISSLDNYGVLDLPGVRVASADTTDLGAVELPFIGIPTPRNVRLSYDTMRQIVTLTWDRADTGLVASYNVYRRNVGLNSVFARINVSPVTDTVYRDSTGVQDSTYEYAVASVNKNATEGTKSTAISLRIVPFMTITDSVTWTSGSRAGGIVIGPAGEVVLRSGDTITVLDSALRRVSSFALPTDFGNGYGLAVDDSGRIWASNYSTGAVNIYTLHGILTDSVRDTALRYPGVLSAGRASRMYISSEVAPNAHNIRIYDHTGQFISMFPNDTTPFLGLVTDMFFGPTGDLTVLNHADSTLTVYDSAGTTLRRIKLGWDAPKAGMFKTGDYAVESRNQAIHLIGGTGQPLAVFTPPGTGDFFLFAIDPSDRLIVRTIRTVFLYSKR